MAFLAASALSTAEWCMGMRSKTEAEGKSRRSLKAYLVSRRWPRMTCATWKARSALRLPVCWAPSAVTTLVVSMRPLERMIVLPTARDSSGSVSRVRTWMGLVVWMLL